MPYVDDVLFYNTNPETTLPSLLTELRAYGALSNYKVNMTKSEALNINLPVRRVAAIGSAFAFKWAQKSIKCLRINVAADLSQLFVLNYLPLNRAIMADMKAWSKDGLSWFGHKHVKN